MTAWRRLGRRRSYAAYAVGAAIILAGAFAASPPAGATAPVTPFYLALGGSGSVGIQPTAAHPRGQPTDSGYANDLLGLERSRWEGLKLVQLGCPGATTASMLTGAGHCHYREGSQLGAALSFLRDHPSTVLITVDLGFNDLLPCLRHRAIDDGCVTEGLGALHDQLTQALAQLRAAAPRGTMIVGVGHYDPYLGDYVRPDGQPFALATISAIDRLDEVMRSAYAAEGVPMASVAPAFDMTESTPVKVPSLGGVPENVARVCSLTWMCAPPPLGPNSHPDDAGYRIIAVALGNVIDSLSG
ncbi:MAG TPA: SGNH/GDSL hydrolase family protein [Acidimicrobiales bacterium]